MRCLALLVTPVFLLAACGRADKPAEPPRNDDPALAAALGDEITIDPDLPGQNRANAVASLPSTDGSVPSLDVTPAAIGRARSDALALVGGPGEMRTAPAARAVAGTLPPDAALSAAARAAHAPGTGACAAKAQYTAAWAAKLPTEFPVYPRGAVQEAAGTDADGCALRVVNFRTPVPVGEVMDFYFTRATKAGFSTQHVLQDGDHVLGGTKGKASYTLYARKLPGGATEVDLVTSG
ncbi:MAG: hypothetical protein ABIT09_13495 [Croceibacterium sp.]